MCRYSICVYDGKIVMRGKPYEVFSEKEILEAANLGPCTGRFILYLREKGLDTTVPTTLEQAKTVGYYIAANIYSGVKLCYLQVIYEILQKCFPVPLT